MPVRDSQFNAQHVAISANAIGASDSVASSDAYGSYIEIYSTLDQDVVVSVTDLVGAKKPIVIYGNAPIPRLIPCLHDGAIYIRHGGTAPTTGNIRIQSIFSGNTTWKKNYS